MKEKSEMMKEEFDKLVDFETRYSEYEEIEKEYMGTDIDKVKFATQWKKNGGIARLARMRTREIEELSERLRCLESNYRSVNERENRKDIEHKAELEKLVSVQTNTEEVVKNWMNRYKDVSQKYEELKRAIKIITEAVA
jgi:alkyl hydroperoxide reductase subunit AhpC